MTTTETTHTNPDEYNGSVNRETHMATLNLSNDYDLYQIARRLVTQADADVVEWYADHDAELPPIEQTNAAADALAEWVAGMVADYHDTERHHTTDLMRCMISDVGSFWRVDWKEVAHSFRDE